MTYRGPDPARHADPMVRLETHLYRAEDPSAAAAVTSYLAAGYGVEIIRHDQMCWADGKPVPVLVVWRLQAVR